MSSPTFTLPACALCSHRGSLIRPTWRNARLTSYRTGQPHWIFSGCQHAVDPSKAPALHSTEESWRQVEEKWAKEFEAMFEAKTARWSVLQRANFRVELMAGATLPGVADALPLSPGSPAQQNNEPTKEETNG